MHVSIHSLTQRETHSNNMQYTGETVSIHSLTQRETGQTFLHDLEFALFQSTPSRRGRLFSLRRHSGVWWVSIHSLTQRETRSTLQSECRPVVSIHSLTQRETLHLFYVTKIGIVSIHSLTQRETWPAGFVWFLWRCFNPLPHAEGDYEHGRLEGLRLCFNPLPHAEGDTASISSSLVGNAFQSTPSRRGRRFL